MGAGIAGTIASVVNTLFATVSTLFLYYNGVDTHIGTFLSLIHI